jgi:hypothetical protein
MIIGERLQPHQQAEGIAIAALPGLQAAEAPACVATAQLVQTLTDSARTISRNLYI